LAGDGSAEETIEWHPRHRRLRVGGRTIPTDDEFAVVPSLRADPGAMTLSFQDLASALDGHTGRLPPALAERVAGRYVLIGQTAHSIGDHGPAADGRIVPLVHVHAALLSDLLEGVVLVDAGAGSRLLALAILALLFIALGTLLRPATAAFAAALGIGAIWLVVAWLTEGPGLLMPPVSLTLVALVSFGAATLTRMIVQERERRVLRNAFGAYVAPEVLDRVLDDPEAFLAPQGTRKRLSILFSDVQGYTRLSNTLPPEEVVGLLREYLDAMTRIIFRHEGRVDKIMGDGILAYFGDLVPVADHARRAVQCGLEMQAELERLVRRWEGEGKDGLLVRVGVATGEVFVGNIGGAGHLEYTVIGPTVNLAARLESNAPPTGVLVSKETFEETREAFEYRIVPGLALKGFGEAYTAFLCVGTRAPASGDAEERRRALRMQVEAPVRVGLREGTRAGVVREVSAGGLLVELDGPASRDEILTVVFDEAVAEALPSVHLAGRIRHVRPADGGRIQVGVALLNVESGDPTALREFVALFFGAFPAEDRGEVLGDAGVRFSWELDETYGRLIRHDGGGVDEGGASDK
jgi:class 3 adenylate cyclase